MMTGQLVFSEGRGDFGDSHFQRRLLTHEPNAKWLENGRTWLVD